MNDYESEFLSSLDSFVDNQNTDKETKVKKISNKLKKISKNTKLRDFKLKYPHLVKHRQILYPIEDTLLWAKPKLHNIEENSPPAEHFSMYSSEVLENLIYICDFCNTFQYILKAPALKCESLYTALNFDTETLLSKQVHIALLKPLVHVMLKLEGFRKKGPLINYLVYKSKKFIPILKFLDYSYLKFLENVFRIDE